eukprot:scaffold1147_cov125-Isochrysis_galbana.AAC.5
MDSEQNYAMRGLVIVRGAQRSVRERDARKQLRERWAKNSWNWEKFAPSASLQPLAFSLFILGRCTQKTKVFVAVGAQKRPTTHSNQALLHACPLREAACKGRSRPRRCGCG